MPTTGISLQLHLSTVHLSADPSLQRSYSRWGKYAPGDNLLKYVA